MSVSSYRDLKVWQAAMDLAVECHNATAAFPKEEVYGLTSQIRRAAGSVPANIAEGHGRETTGAFVQFCRVAQGSLKELETHLILAGRLSYLDGQVLEGLLARSEAIGKMVRAMIRSLQQRMETQ